MSNSTRTDTLVMQAIRGVQKNRRGSAKTRHNHIKEARRFVNTIRELGYGVKRWKNISNKHVHEAVNKWQQEGLQVATIKEYLSGVRFVCRIYGNDRIAAERIAGQDWRKLNQDARQIIKAELGHGPDRDDVVSQYLGAI